MVQKHRSLTLGIVLGAALLLAGCPSPSPRPSAPSNPDAAARGAPSATAPQQVPFVPRPQTPARENHLSPATRSLVAEAHRLLGKGDIDGASATLDRALRIEPTNPLLWIELGRVRLTESDAHQAEVCARKALALASGDAAAQAGAGRVLADALKAQGRNPEAQAVERRPYMR